MPEIQEQLRLAQSRVKALAAKRDQIIRDAGVEEQKLQQVYENLRQLGVKNPETMSEAELKTLAETTSMSLGEALHDLMESLSKGEALLLEYDKFQQ
jgi:uncharacterized membrane protein